MFPQNQSLSPEAAEQFFVLKKTKRISRYSKHSWQQLGPVDGNSAWL